MQIGIITDTLDRGPPSIALFVRKLVENLSELVDPKLIHNKKINNDVYRSGRELLIKEPAFFYRSFLPLLIRRYKLDIIHLPCLGGGEAPPITWYMRNAGMIVTLHGADIAVLNPSIYPFYTDYLKGRILFAKSRSIYRLLADDERFHVVTVSNSEKRNLEKNIGIPEEKISVVYNGVDHQKFRALKNKDEIIEELRLKYGIHGKFVFHLSSFHPKKNVPTLLRAFQSLKKNYEVEHKLVLCGPQDKYSRKVSPLVSLLNLNKDVSYIGYIPETDLPKFYNAADFFAFPSLHESFGLPILEAMASGCPVLTSKAYSMPEIAGNSAVLINPSDAQEIADAMYEMTVNHKLRQDCRRKGLERAKLFTWKKCAEEYVRIYKKFCTG